MSDYLIKRSLAEIKKRARYVDVLQRYVFPSADVNMRLPPLEAFSLSSLTPAWAV